jgi:hypothetical protein
LVRDKTAEAESGRNSARLRETEGAEAHTSADYAIGGEEEPQRC